MTIDIYVDGTKLNCNDTDELKVCETVHLTENNKIKIIAENPILDITFDYGIGGIYIDYS